MKRTSLSFGGILLLGFILITFLTCTQKEAEPSPAPSRPAGPRSALVDAMVVKGQKLEQIINATGNLIAYESVEIRPERAGKLVQLDFKESGFVKKNTILGQVDDSELVAQKSRLSVNLELAEKEVARGDELLKIQGISQEEVDRLINRVKDIKAERQILDIQIEKSKIRAPFSGVLGLRQVSQGAFVTSNDVIAQLKQINPIKLEFEIPERYLPVVKQGQGLTFTIVGSDENFQAKVYAIGNEISPLTRTFKVRAKASNSNNMLKPGQFAKVTLITGINEQAILIPTGAVIPVLDGRQVYLIKNGKSIAQRVITEDRSATEVHIIEGISIGDTVITSGLLALSNGGAIRLNQLSSSENAQ